MLRFPHKLADCPRFAAEAICKRKRLVKKFNVCFSCLESGHEAKDCLHKIAGELNHLLQVRQPDPKPSKKECWNSLQCRTGLQCRSTGTCTRSETA